MSLNIKSADAESLAREVAALTGETLTAAVATSLRQRLQRLRAEHGVGDTAARAERVLALGADIAPRLVEPWVSQDHGDLLYDDRGLPA